MRLNHFLIGNEILTQGSGIIVVKLRKTLEKNLAAVEMRPFCGSLRWISDIRILSEVVLTFYEVKIDSVFIILSQL